jgi:membrane-associated phospholipid phosphatase
MIKRIFVIFGFCVISSTLVAQNVDINLLKSINLHRNESFDPLMKTLSNTTAAISVAVPVTLFTYSLIKKDSINTRKAFTMGVSVVSSALIIIVLKYAVNRPRPFVTYPEIDQAISVSSASFPSGHTGNSFALATSLSLAYPKWYVIVPSYAWASSVAYSRMHLGVHYPSDVLAGAIIGAGSSFLCYKLNKWLSKKYY